MGTRSETKNDLSARELVITRLINAPRELVFEAWTDIKHLANWWGPRGFSITTEKRDFKAGGVWKFVMHGPDGRDYPNKITFDEIIKPEKIVFHHSGDDESEGVSHITTATFEKQGNKTLINMTLLFSSAEERKRVVEEYGAAKGGIQTIDRLAEQVERMSYGKEFVITRELNAPLDLVWKVYTSENHLAKWWGPKGFKMLKAKLDLRPGGTFHYGMQSPDGHSMWGKFVYRDIVPGKKLVFIVSFSDENGGVTRHPMAGNWPLEVFNTVTFEERNGKTFLTISGFPINASDEERKIYDDSHAGMQQGFKGTMDQLEEYLKETQH
jgi:uncharacterized protein YndB with AHSA1/START domain